MKLIFIFSAIITYCLAVSVPPIQRAVAFKESLLNVPAKQARIVNGQPATPNLIPHQVSVLSPVPGGLTVCGGSLISLFWVCSAAHCTIGHAQFNLRFGSINLQTGGVTQISFSFIHHPLYNPSNLNNDISVISIPTLLVQSPAIIPIRLSTLGQVTTTFVGVQARASGWGYTHLANGASELLNYVFMNPITNANCASFYGNQVVQDSVICAFGWDANNQGICGGDAGGPLAITEQEGAVSVDTLIGIISFGSAAGCTAPHPHGFMRISAFAQWIQAITGIPIRP